MGVLEKITSLLNDVQETGVNEIPAGFGYTKQYITNERVASHLISNGVTVQEWIPAADVVEVVRCMDCKHWKSTGSKGGKSFSDMEYIGGCKFTNCCRRESDFCSYGERKDGGENDA